MGRNTEIAKAIINAYIGQNGDFTAEGLFTLYEIQNGNNELLLEHVKALKNIFEKAIEEIENDRQTY